LLSGRYGHASRRRFHSFPGGPIPARWDPELAFEGGCYAFNELTIEDEPQLRRATHFINAGMRRGELSPVIDRTFDLTDVVRAHQHLESNTQFGKVVLVVP
jgi:NADPH:quinone reductase-like Zn-dependent oxidoreductase